MQKSGGRRGQVTIFIIIAIVIIAVVATVFYVIPKTRTGTSFDPQNPQGFVQNCLDGALNGAVETVSLQGGSLDPEFYFAYQGNNLEYLCYTNQYYNTCVIQRVLLKDHVESEIKEAISSDVASCFANLEASYEADGYTVNLENGRTEVELLPKRVIINLADYVLTVSKGETSRYDEFNVVLNNNLYELISIAESIVEWEATYGDAETTLYMSYYKDLKVEKHVQQDGTTVYIITDRNTESKFQFASRSGAWPPGYGDEGVSVSES